MPTFAYWDVKARGNLSRLLIAYGNEAVYDEVYNVPNDMAKWRQDHKPNLGLDFPNLPYYINGDFKMTESTAIASHLARKYNLYGQTQNEAAVIDMILSVATDLKNANIKTVWDPKFEENWNEFVNGLAEKHYQPLQKFLGEKDWFVGCNVTLADFAVYDAVTFCLEIAPDSLDKFSKLKEHRARLEALPKIQKYFNSPQSQFKPYALKAQENLESTRK